MQSDTKVNVIVYNLNMDECFKQFSILDRNNLT